MLALGPFAAALRVAVAGGLAGGPIGFLRAQGLSPEEAVDVPTATRTYTEFGAHPGFDKPRTGSPGAAKPGPGQT